MLISESLFTPQDKSGRSYIILMVIKVFLHRSKIIHHAYPCFALADCT